MTINPFPCIYDKEEVALVVGLEIWYKRHEDRIWDVAVIHTHNIHDWSKVDRDI